MGKNTAASFLARSVQWPGLLCHPVSMLKLMYLQMYRLTIRASKDGVAKVLSDLLETQF